MQAASPGARHICNTATAGGEGRAADGLRTSCAEVLLQAALASETREDFKLKNRY